MPVREGTVEGAGVHLGFGLVYLVLKWNHFHPGPYVVCHPQGCLWGVGRCGERVRWSAGARPGPRGATGTKASRVTRRALACLSHHCHPPAMSFPSTSWETTFPSASWPFHWPLEEPFSCPTSALHPHPPNTSTLRRLLQILAALRPCGWATASAVKTPDTKVPRGGCGVEGLCAL